MGAKVRLVEGLLGASLALLVLCIGLWRESLAPALAGASPRGDVSTMVGDFGFAAEFQNRLPLRYLESLVGTFGQWSWSGSMSHRRPVQVEDRVIETRFELVFGPMFEDLGVPIAGRALSAEATRLPLSPQPVREVVLGQALALRLFGSPEAALGKYLNLAMMRWRVTGEGLAPFLVVGVASPGFVGANIEVPAEFWIGVNGWHDVLFPAQQSDELRRAFGAGTVLVRSDDPGRAAQAISDELQRLGEPAVHISLIPGAGYHPARRDRFARISEGLLVGVQALAWTLAVCAIAIAWLGIERSRQGNRVRRMLGEPVRIRLIRESRAAAWRLATIGLGFAAVCALCYLGDGRGVPIRAALIRGLNDPLALTGMALSLASLSLLPPTIARATAWSRRMPGRFAPSASQALFAALLASASVTWFAGTASVERLLRLASGGLSEAALATGVTQIESDFRRYLIDDSSTRAMEDLFAGQSIALAGTGPLGAPVEAVRGAVESSLGTQPAVLPINHVSHNYFDVTGMAVLGVCSRKSQWTGDAVLVNAAFASRYFGEREATLHRLVESDGRIYQVCGTVDGAHAVNARAGSAPMVYAPLTQRRHLRVAVTRGLPDSAQVASMNRALDAWFPDAYLAPTQVTSNLAAAQLKQERDVIALNLAMMAISGLVGFGAALLLGRAAIATGLRSIATRRALGASGAQLVHAALVGRSAVLWGGVAVLWIAALVAGVRVLGPGSNGVLVGAMAALATPILLATLVSRALRRDVADERLIHALRAE